MTLGQLQQYRKSHKEMEELLDDVACQLAEIYNLRYKYLSSFSISADNKEIYIVIGDWEVGDTQNGCFTISLYNLVNLEEFYAYHRGDQVTK